jgi:hypothetical protein
MTTFVSNLAAPVALLEVGRSSAEVITALDPFERDRWTNHKCQSNIARMQPEDFIPLAYGIPYPRSLNTCVRPFPIRDH